MAIVGKFNPRMEEELRIYVGKYPEKAAEFLRSAKTVFKEAMGSTQRQEMKKTKKQTKTGGRSEDVQEHMKQNRGEMTSTCRDAGQQKLEAVRWGLLSILGLVTLCCPLLTSHSPESSRLQLATPSLVAATRWAAEPDTPAAGGTTCPPFNASLFRTLSSSNRDPA